MVIFDSLYDVVIYLAKWCYVTRTGGRSRETNCYVAMFCDYVVILQRLVMLLQLCYDHVVLIERLVMLLQCAMTMCS